jgi:hypothetical protein
MSKIYTLGMSLDLIVDARPGKVPSLACSPIFQTRYISNNGDPAYAGLIMEFVSAFVLLLVYCLSIYAIIVGVQRTMSNPNDENLKILFLLAVPFFIIAQIVMQYFPFKPISITITETEISFRSDNTGFMMIGTFVRYSLIEPLGIDFFVKAGILEFIQGGKKKYDLNLRGLRKNDRDSFLKLIEKHPNIKIIRK